MGGIASHRGQAWVVAVPPIQRRLLSCLAVATALTLAGCAAPLRSLPRDEAMPFWSGRLALQVQSDQSQSFSASFELKGSAQQGELALYSPLGSTVAQLAWEPGNATLRSNGETRRFDSIEALSAQATGTPLPLGTLFDWLAGKPTELPGWQADLSMLAEGRLVARRTAPPPAAVLRIAFER